VAGKGVHHEFQPSHGAVAGSSDRSFGLVFAGFFTLLGLYNGWYGGQAWSWLIVVAALFLAVALIRASLLQPLNKLWTKLGLLLGAIINPIVLGLLFFLVFTPIGALARLLGKDFLGLKRKPEAESYWISRDPPGPEPASMKDQF
jgi:hypothetical protein